MNIRRFEEKDTGPLVLAYKRAFDSPPWHGVLSEEEALSRFVADRGRPGFSALVAEEDGSFAGASWWDEITIECLRFERGDALADFCLATCGAEGLIWFRATIVDPESVRRGVATSLKTESFRLIFQEGGRFVFTRFRADNGAIIAVNEKFGMRPTGIRFMAPMKHGPVAEVLTEYWYLDIQNLLTRLR